MFRREGMTLMEIIVVLIIVGIAAAFFFPNYTTPTEQARAANARNNLLAIYSAQQNYYNNYGFYCTRTTGNTIPCGDTLADINTNLSLNIQDDGTYRYNCVQGALTNTCTARRNNAQLRPLLTLYLGQAINLSGSGTANPQCSDPSHNPSWCPF